MKEKIKGYLTIYGVPARLHNLPSWRSFLLTAESLQARLWHLPLRTSNRE